MPRLFLLPLLLVACAPSVDEKRSAVPTGGSSGTGQGVAVLATVSDDYATGALATVQLDDWSVTDTIVDISGDPAVDHAGDWVFQLDRYGHDTVRAYRPGAWGAPEAEWALADGANPHAVAWCDGAAFITEYDAPGIGVWDPARGLVQGRVDLSEHADGDGIPEASSAVVGANGRLYVGAHHFDRDDGWSEAGGAVLEIDCAARAVTASWAVPTPDVFAHPGADTLLVASRDGSLRTLDPATGTLSASLLDRPLPGNVSALAAWGEHAVAVLADADYAYSVHCVSLDDGSHTPIESRANFLTAAEANDRGEVWIAARLHWDDPGGATGTLVYDAETCASLTGPDLIQTLLAPYSIAFF